MHEAHCFQFTTSGSSAQVGTLRGLPEDGALCVWEVCSVCGKTGLFCVWIIKDIQDLNKTLEDSKKGCRSSRINKD